MGGEKMKSTVNNNEWKEFRIDDLFIIKIGKNIDGNKIDKENGSTAYITRKESNNGLDGIVNHKKEFINLDFPVITIGNETAEPFVQSYKFFTGTKVNILKPKIATSKDALFFITQCLKMHKSKYSYSYTINSTRLKKQTLLLPVTNNGQPDYAFMENYMRDKEFTLVENYKNYISQTIVNNENEPLKVKSLSEKKWNSFRIKDIFDVNKGIYLSQKYIKKGEIPYVTAKSENNGICGFIGNEAIFSGNSITIEKVNLSAYYQQNKFYCSHDVSVISNPKLNKYNSIFICNMIKRQGSKYSYGRQAQMNVVKNETIFLPISENGQPDYDYMELFIKQIEQKQLNQFLEYSVDKIPVNC